MIYHAEAATPNKCLLPGIVEEVGVKVVRVCSGEQEIKQSEEPSGEGGEGGGGEGGLREGGNGWGGGGGVGW